MKIKDIMITDVVSVNADETIVNLAETIFANRFHSLPVIEKDKVIGIVTEDDFFLKGFDDLYLPTYISFLNSKKIINQLPEEYKEKVDKLIKAKIRDIMTKECQTVSPEMSVTNLMALVKKTKFKTFPVTDQEKNLIGIVTLSDVLGTIKRGSREMKRSIIIKSKRSKLYNLINDFNNFWNDQLFIVSRKRINTLRGIAIIILIEAILLIIIALTFYNQ